MSKPKIFRNHLSIYDIAKKVGRKPNVVRYHVNQGNYPKPSISLTFIRFIGNTVRRNRINLWTHRQLYTINKRIPFIYRGRRKM